MHVIFCLLSSIKSIIIAVSKFSHEIFFIFTLITVIECCISLYFCLTVLSLEHIFEWVLNHIILFLTLYYFSPELVLHDAVFVPHDYNSTFGPSKHHIHPISVVQKANIAVVIAPHERDDDNLTLLALVWVDGVHGFSPLVGELTHADQVADAGDLRAVGREYAHLVWLDVEQPQFLHHVDDEVCLELVDPGVAHTALAPLLEVDERDGFVFGHDVLVFEVGGGGAVDHLARLEDFVRHLQDGGVHALLVQQFKFDVLQGGQPFNHAPRALEH